MYSTHVVTLGAGQILSVYDSAYFFIFTLIFNTRSTLYNGSPISHVGIELLAVA